MCMYYSENGSFGCYLVISLLNVCHVKTLLEEYPLRPSDTFMQDRIDSRCGLIKSPRRNQGRDMDFRQAICAVPIFDSSDDMEFGGAIHGVVNYARLVHSTLNVRWYWRNTNDVPLVKAPCGR